MAAGGLLLLARIGADGSYIRDVLPGMLVVGVGLGVALVAVAVSVLSGAPDDESGMLSGLNTTGHEIGGSLGVAVLITIAAAAAEQLASASADSVAGGSATRTWQRASRLGREPDAVVVLPSAKTFLPKLRLAPSMPIH